jgi:hypothetical protein
MFTNPSTISSKIHKMISDALLFAPPLQAYFPLKGTATMLARKWIRFFGKGT